MKRFCVAALCALFLATTAFAQPTKGGEGIGAFSRSLQQLVAKVSPAVVQVFTTGYAPSSGFAGSAGLLQTEFGSGSGVILDPNGYIVTNAHVVEGAHRVQVLLSGSGENVDRSILRPRGRVVGAQVVRIDDETDLAVLKIAENNLPYLQLGDSDQLQQGQLVMAFGSPLGLENSVSMGVVSARARQLTPESPMIYVQTDAAINPGNSGGPLVDADGRVIGINTMMLSHSGGDEGMGFAAPSNIVRAVFEQIRDTGRVRRGAIGARAQTITPILGKGLKLERMRGVILSDIHPRGPAAEAGLQVGDIVLRVGGKEMENGRQFTVNLYQRPIGKAVEFEILRAGEIHKIQVNVIERPDEPLRFADMVSPERNLVPGLGILCLEVDERIARLLPGLRQRGVLVAARVPGSAHWEDGFQPGDVIYALNNERLRTLEGLRQKVVQLSVGDAAVFQIERAGELIYLALQL